MDELEKLAKQFQDEYKQSEASFRDDIQQLKKDIEMAYTVYPSVAGGHTIHDAVMDGSAVYSTENRIIEGGIRLAGANQLNLIETIDIDAFNALGEDNVKSKSKIDMSIRMASEITSKTKFTMIKERDKVTVKAKLYAFTETEMIAFIEKIVQIAK